MVSHRDYERGHCPSKIRVVTLKDVQLPIDPQDVEMTSFLVQL